MASFQWEINLALTHAVDHDQVAFGNIGIGVSSPRLWGWNCKDEWMKGQFNIAARGDPFCPDLESDLRTKTD